MIKKATHPRLPLFLVFFITALITAPGCLFAQSGNEFWLAPPDITDLHNPPGGEPLYLELSSTGSASTVTIDQPANGSFTPIVVTVQANKSLRVNLTAFKTSLETRPTNTICNTGLHVTSTTPITCYYECANTNNTDIWALKGPNALGTQFYIPLHKHAPFHNEASFSSPNQAFASFDICATQNGTVVQIYSPTQVDGHAALQQFSITLNRGQTYSCGWTGANWDQPSTHPSGAVVISSQPVTVSLKDDSDHNPSGGCYDILGDQIVPTNVVGEDYIAVKGSLNNTGDESVVLMATQNNTQVFLDGNATPVATLFAGEYFRIDIDSLSASTNNAIYIHCTQPTYAMHITGFGCEMGMAELPPLNCAGSQALNFVRDDAQTFYITLLCRTAAVNSFTITGPGTATINPASFVTVPGTGGTWKAARIQYNTTQVPVDSTFHISNSVDVFALGVINGGAATGCKYGYFSEFVAPITVNAGIDQTICANTSATMAGVIGGGTTTGIWTTSGTGTFAPSNTALNAVYTPSAGDASLGSVTLTLTSTGACNPVSDQMVLTITPAPTVNAGPDQSVCRNNSNVSLNGSVTVATGGVWTGGAGTFVPNNSTLNAVYIPTAAELAAGTLVLTLTTTGNGICNPTSDNMVVTFTNAPVVGAGSDQTKCANNPNTTLAGSVSGATGGVWSGGAGSFTPTPTTLNAVYTPTGTEISSGSVTLTLTSTGNGTCNAVTDQMTIFFTAAPTANAGPDQTKCANNATTTLAGSVTIASGGQWSGGLGTFAPSNNALNATYTPTAAEISAGSVTLTLTTTGNGSCSSVTDQMTIFFTPAPTVNAGVDQTVCANNSTVTLNGSFTVASGAVWTGGAGTFTPNNTTMNATYTPTAAERAAGTVTLTLTTTGNGTCSSVSDQMIITITPSPTVNAGSDQTKCANNPATVLAGSVTVASGGQWSGGAGTFSPNNTTLNATYTPTAAEISGGSVTLTLTSTGNGSCNSVTDQMTIFFTPAPTVNAGPDQTKCGNNATTILAGSVTVASGGQWSGGLGIFTPNNNTLNASYTPTAAEIASGSVTLTLTTTGNGSCSSVTDQMTIFFTPAPTVNAGPDQVVCANNPVVTLNGSFTIASGVAWSGGAGTFSPGNTTPNATYTPTAGEIAAGSVTLTLTTTGNGTCNSVSDQVLITISPAPVVNAGADINSCANNSTVSLNGQVFNAGGGQWSGGSGTFFPNSTTLNATYTPSAAEISAGSVTLTLTSTGNGTCSAVSDQVVISYAPSPVANAGSDQTVCGNNATVSLGGFVNFCAGGQWSGGLGLFSPSATSLNATYTPTAGEIASGFVNIILTTTGNGSCNPARDTMRINFTPAPTADAGAPVTSCANNSAVTLNGTITVASGGLWSGGAGSFSPSNTALGATYTPSASEISGGGVTLFLTTTGNGTCLPVSDSVHITITPSPVVNAGVDQTVCVSNMNANLSGSISGPTNTGTWTTSGSGTFTPNNTTLNAAYHCSAADSLAGSVTLTLTSTNNGSCNAVSDQMVITILPAGSSNAGSDIVVCANNGTISLSGTIGGGATGGTWSSSGTGVFTPNASSLNANYIPSSFDIANGGATIYLTANSCNPAVDSLLLTITPAPVVNAGSDMIVCAATPDASLNGTISGGSSTGVWTTSGSGTFTPSSSALNATYSPSAADIAAQNVYLVLTSTNNGSCSPVSDTMILHIYPTGTANAGPDQIVCSNNPNISLNGALGGGATQGQWSTTGTGSFIPNDTTLNATYVPSSADISSGSLSLVLTATNSCNNAVDFLNVIFSPAPVVDAGSPQSTCGANPSVILNGSVSNATGGVWSSGGGTFAPNNTTLNATYSPDAAEQAAGYVILTLTSTGNGNCNAVSDTVRLTFSPGIVANAGVDQSVCISASYTQLNGIVSNGSTTGVWSTLGSGTFTPNDSALNAVYNFSTADTAAGSVTIVLSSTNNGTCPVAHDTMHITFGPSAFAYAGMDQSVCSSDATIQLNGFVAGGATQGMWTTSGGGTFSPNDSTLNAVYTLTPSDIAAGQLTFILETTDHGGCFPGIDTVMYFIAPTSVVSAGGDVTICSDNLSVPLGGNVSGASSTGMWTTSGSGAFVPNNTALNGTYIPSASDSLAGSVMLILTSTNTGSCAATSDTMMVFISYPAVVNAGPDQSVCSVGAVVSLNGNVSGGTTTGIWSAAGSGTFTPSNTTLGATYTPSAADIAAGSVTLYLTSTGNGICAAREDSMVVTIVPAAVVNAGNDIVVCGSNTDVPLNGTITGITTTGIWTTGGSGIFNPNATTLNANYALSNADVLGGSVTLVLTSTNNNICPSVSDTTVITIEPLPVAAFSSVSGDSLNVDFTDQSSGAVSWYWTFGDGGTSTQQNPQYNYPSSGSYQVVLVITSAGGCSDTATSNVNANEATVQPVAVPTGFSPNSDAHNDVLHVLGGPFSELDFKIYNEWGNLIFSTQDPNGGWDGTYKGKPQPGGIYVYTVTGKTIDGKDVNLSGNVTLIR